jgi:hypothetical protein
MDAGNGGQGDGGQSSDAGNPISDGGQQSDASMAPDGGSDLDGGGLFQDAAVGVESGPAVDSGVVNVGDGGADAGFVVPSDGGLDSGLDAGLDAGVDSGIDAGVDSGLDSGVDSGLDSGVDSGVDAGVDGGGCSPTWWDCNWGQRLQLTFDNSGQAEDLDDFVTLVHLTTARADFDLIENNGNDLRFIDQDHTTVLPYEIERITANDIWVWVKVPRIDASSTTDHIWVYFANVGAPSGEDVANVWTGDYRAVLHLADRNSSVTLPGTISDSDTSSTVNGRIGRGQEFDSNNSETLQISSDQPLFGTMNSWTASAWINAETLHTNWRGIISARLDSENDFSSGNFVIHTHNDDFGLETQGEVANDFRSPLSTPRDWHHLTVTYDGTNNRTRLFVDGQQVNERAISPKSFTDQNTLLIGARYFSSNYTAYFDGIIDEVRIENGIRTNAWIRAQYLSQGDGFIRYEENPWHIAGMTHRVEIPLDTSSVKEHLQDFPLRVSLDLSDGSYAWDDNGGDDFRFVDGDGTILDHEVEEYLPGTLAEIWVKIPQVNAFNTLDRIWLYYGDGAATDIQDAPGVWSNGYLGVYHLNGDADNSASGFNDGTPDCPTPIAGRVAEGYDFFDDDGGGDCNGIWVSDNASLDDIDEVITLSAWARPDNFAGIDWDSIITRARGTGGGNHYHFGFYQQRANFFIDRPGGSGAGVFQSSTVASVNTWVHLAATLNGRVRTLYQDGSLDVSGDSTGSFDDSDYHDLIIGADSNDDGNSFTDHFEGIIDEARISNVDRSAAWIEADYWSQANALISAVGAEEDSP